MKELLQHFSPEISSELVGEELEEKKPFPLKAEKVFDVHGYFEREIPEKMKCILDFCTEKKFSRIKIITGKGKQILFSEVKRCLQKFLHEGEIFRYSNDEGSFEIFFPL